MSSRKICTQEEPRCIICSTNFYFREPTHPFGSKCPLILHCGHSSCEGCLTNALRNDSTITCPVCTAASVSKKLDQKNIKRSEILSLREDFPLNVYAVGQVILKRNKPTSGENHLKMNFISKNKTSENSAVKCNECSEKKADCSCQQCKTQLCSDCFTTIHSLSVTLRKHEKISLKEMITNKVLEENMCHSHKGLFQNIYCKDCEMYMCKECSVEKHLEHCCTDVYQLNKPKFPEFSVLFDEANKVLKHLYATKKKIQQPCAKDQVLEEEAKKVEEQVQNHFNYMHGKLQRQEEELIKKIRSVGEEAQNSLESVAEDLEKNINEVENILSLSTRIAETMIKEFPLDCLLEKLRNIAETPCHLVLNNDDDSKFQFNVDTEITENLRAHCTVNVPTKKKMYQLCSNSDLPESYKVEDLKDATEPFLKPDLLLLKPVKDKEKSLSHQQALLKAITAPSPPLPQTEVKTKRQDFARKNHPTQKRKNLSESVSSISSQESSVDKICSVEPLVEGKTDIVRMIHFLSPTNFYVQRKCNVVEIENLRNYFAKHFNRTKSPPTAVELGQMYLVKYATDGKWYRARPINVVGNVCDIFYVDYGNIEQNVNIKNLREIPDKYAEIPDQAIHCGLINCIPVGGKWAPGASSIIAKMASSSDLSMYVERINQESGYHEVYLRKADDDTGSLADALIFCGYATTIESPTKMMGLFKQSSIGNRKKWDFKGTIIKENEIFDGRVTHINSPTNFYMQKITDSGELLMKIMAELSQTYSKYSPDEGLIFTPHIGMSVAAKFQDDGSWYRGTILGLPDTRKVEVKYVDYGNVSVIDIEDIRKLQPKFLRIGAQALRCSLNDIAPKHPRGWPSSAKTVFENLVMKKGSLLRVWVAKVKDDNSLSVVLYETTPTKYININGVLVKKRHAFSTGQTSAQAEYACRPEYEVKDQELVMSDSESDCTELSGRSKTSGDSNNKMSKSQTELSEETVDQEIDGRLKVQVLKIISPAEIYITHVNTPKLINKLISEMTTFYMTQMQIEEEQDWTPGDLCAVLKMADNKWFRGVIIESYHNSFKVFIKDIVEMVDVDKSMLRNLEQRFCQVQDGSIKVHLWGLNMPGGMKVWPASTTDYLRRLLEESDAIYIEEVDNVVNNSLPVRIWRRTQKQGGPLDPLRDEWCDVNNALVSMGFALIDPAAKEKALSSMTVEQSENYVISWLDNSFKVAAEASLDSTFRHVAAQAPLVSTFRHEEVLSVKSMKPRISCSQRRSNRGHSPSKRASYIPGRIGPDALPEVKEWPPAQPFDKLNFVGVPTYVDFDCNIYIRDIASDPILELLEKAFLSLFDKSEKRPYEEEYFEGQICVAFFEPTKKWYRGKVLKVKPEYIEVLFVDYGNVEELQPHELRKQVTLGHIPAQCHKCRTDGIIPVSPDGKWPIKALDFIHSTIVEKRCEISLKPRTEACEDYIILSLKLPGGQDLLETLMSMHYATYVVDCETLAAEDDKDIIEEQQFQIYSNIQESKALVKEIQSVYSNYEMPKTVSLQDLGIEESINDEVERISGQISHEVDSNRYDWYDEVEHAVDPSFNPGFITELDTTPTRDLQFKELIVPASLVEFSVEVQIVSSHNSLKVVILSCDDPEITAFLNEFAALQELMQEEAEILPMLTFPVKDFVCIGCYTEDDTWYRAVIKDVFPDENMVKVCYVDYGNVEKIPVTRLRQIKPEWTLVPVQAIQVTLHNVREGPNYDAATCHASLMSCFTQPPYTLTIESRFPRVEVELYNSQGELAYNPCIDSGLICKD